MFDSENFGIFTSVIFFGLGNFFSQESLVENMENMKIFLVQEMHVKKGNVLCTKSGNLFCKDCKASNLING